MSNMEEISYWVYTKRAPCLFNYDNQIKKQFEQAQCSKPISVHSSPEKASTPKKTKRKLVILGDDSVSSEKLENLYFGAPHTPKLAPPVGSNKSKSVGSDIDFNIKKSSIQHHPKRKKLQNTNRNVVHKKIKVATSTPKVMNGVRRSLRKTHTMVNNNNLLNNSFESSDPCNKEKKANESQCNTLKTKHKQVVDKMDINLENKHSGGHGDAKKSVADKIKKEIKLIGQFDDVSDVSGFTVHYVKSTKVNSTRNPRTLRTRVNRTVVKEAPTAPNIEKNMIVCVDKSINTDLPVNNTKKNSSTESSQNVIKLVSLESHDKSIKINKGTSVMNLVDLRVNNKYKQNMSKNKLEIHKRVKQHDDSVDFKNTNGTLRRYPKRRNLQQVRECTIVTRQASKNRSAEMRAEINNTSDQFNNSDVKENPEVLCASRTRSGRNVGLTLRQSDNSVLVVNNTVDLVSSTEAINVASPKRVRKKTDNSNSVRKKRREAPNKRVGRLKKVLDTSEKSLGRDSLREKSGFSACFSDSDDEKPLKQKFFC